MAIGFPFLSIVILSMFRGNYSRHRPFWMETKTLTAVIFFSIALGFVAIFAFKVDISRLWIFPAWFSLFLLVPFYRYVAKKYMAKFNMWYRPLIVVGTGARMYESAAALTRGVSIGYRVAAYIELKAVNGDPTENKRQHKAAQSDELKKLLLSVVGKFNAPHLLVVFEDQPDVVRYTSLLDSLMLKTERLILEPPMNGIPHYGTQLLGLHRYDGMFLSLRSNLQNPLALLFKRVFDIVLSASLLLLLSPVLIYFYARIALDGGSPVFSHQRIGRHGNPFGCLKFRTMKTNAAELLQELLDNDEVTRAEWARDFKLKSDPRITKIGSFLRRSSLDELPQLWNVLKGEMSLVGPRPIVAGEIEYYGNKFTFYLATWPGMTG